MLGTTEPQIVYEETKSYLQPTRMVISSQPELFTEIPGHPPLVPLDVELARNPNNIDALLQGAKISLDSGNIKEAIGNYLNILKIDPQNRTAKDALQFLSRPIFNYTEAPRHIYSTQSRATYTEKFVDLLIKNSVFPNLEDLNIRLTIFPDNIAVRLERAQIYENQGRINEAIQDYQYILSQYPQNSIAKERLMSLQNLEVKSVD